MRDAGYPLNNLVRDQPHDKVREGAEVGSFSAFPAPYMMLLCVSEQQEAIVQVTRAESSPPVCVFSSGIAVFHALGVGMQDWVA